VPPLSLLTSVLLLNHDRTCPLQTSYIPHTKSHIHFAYLGRLSKESVQFRGPLWHFVTIFFIRWVCRPTSNPQYGGPPLVGCPRLHIQYIHSYSPYLEAVSFIRNRRARLAVVIRGPTNMGLYILFAHNAVLWVAPVGRKPDTSRAKFKQLFLGLD
jgi:hypothetical protein